MRVPVLILGALLSWGAASAQAADAVVEVSYAPQGRFIDAGESARDVTRTEAALTGHLQSLGARYLPAGATLKVVVTEIDLAGRVPLGRSDLPRVMSGGADWPRISFSYDLSRADGGTDSGVASVSDMSYLMRPPLAGRHDPLTYERRMLDDWFRGRFDPPASASRLSSPPPG